MPFHNPFWAKKQKEDSVKKTITITPDPVTMVAGSAIPELTYTITGLTGDERLTGTFVFFLEEAEMSIRKEFTADEDITFTFAQQTYISSHTGVHTYSLDYLGDELHNPASATGTITVTAAPGDDTPEPYLIDWDFTLRQSPAFDGSRTDPIMAGKEYIVLARFTNKGNSEFYNVNFTCALTTDIYNFDSVAPDESKQQAFSYRATDSDVLAGTITFVVSLTADTIDPDNPSITDSAMYTFGVER